MIPANQIIYLSKDAFWDVNMEKMDYEKNADYIIRKVFEYGSMEDVLEVMAFYGKEKVKKALITAPYLKEITMVFASKLFDISIEDFKCSTTRQLHPIS